MAVYRLVGLNDVFATLRRHTAMLNIRLPGFLPISAL